jgi:hypothetical protein
MKSPLKADRLIDGNPIRRENPALAMTGKD